MAVSISPGMGITFKAGGQFVGEVVSLNGPSYSKTMIETTHLGLTSANHFRTMMQGINDAGEVIATYNYDPDDVGQAIIMADIASDVGSALLAFILTLNDGSIGDTTFGFNGIITSFGLTGIEVDGIVQAEITIDISGKPAYSVGS